MTAEYHFLYVEDDPTSRVVMEMVMQYCFEVCHLTIFEDSTNFAEKLRAISPQPDVIFLDIHMRPYTGFEMLKMLRAMPEYANTTVIALTASVMSEEVNQLKTSGFNGAIAKPLNREAFPDLLARILDGQPIWYIN